MNLIDYPDTWDAVKICDRCAQQIWDEILAVECPDLDDKKDVIPAEVVRQVFEFAGHKLLIRIQERIVEGTQFDYFLELHRAAIDSEDSK